MTVQASVIVNRALEILNVFAPGMAAPAAEDSDLGIRALKTLLDAFQLDPQAVIGLQEFVYTPTGGQQTITIGATGQIVTTRQPARIELSSFYRLNGVDRPVGIANSFEEYTAQANKSVQSLQPFIYYMRNDSDVGTIYLWPASNGSYELHLFASQEVVSGYNTLTLTSNLSLPNGYQKWLEDILAYDLCEDYSVPTEVMARLEKRASRASARLKRANFVSRQLQQPVEVPRRRVYSITTDFL